MSSRSRSLALIRTERCLCAIGCLLTLVGFVAVGRGLATGQVAATAVGAACTPVGLLALTAFLYLHYAAGRPLGAPLHVSREREPGEGRSERRVQPSGCDGPAAVDAASPGDHSLHLCPFFPSAYRYRAADSAFPLLPLGTYFAPALPGAARIPPNSHRCKGQPRTQASRPCRRYLDYPPCCIRRTQKKSMASDKHLLIRSAPRYPGCINVLLFCGTLSACVGVALCVYSVIYCVDHVAWIVGTVTFTIGVALSVVSMLYIVVSVLRKRTIQASWVQNSVSPYEDDFATDYYFNDDSFVYKPTTYSAPRLMVSSKPVPVRPNAYQLVFGADQK